jgi:6-phosphogluconolactonase (cycloisomerase 2 family)
MKIVRMKLTAATALLFVSLPALAAEFHAYAPSGERQALLTVAIEPAAGSADGSADGSSAAPPVHATPLGFKGSTIVAHPSQPWLYVSGAAAAAGGPNAAVVRLGADGLPESVEACTLDRGYCWLSIDRTERFLLGCDYGTGKVDIFPLDAAGKPGERCGGADQGRKEGHCVQPTPDNRFVYVPHVKGNNALFQYAFDEATGKIVPLAPVDVGPPEGSGPRHVAYHPTLPMAYFSEEQGLGVSVYERASDGRLTLRSRPRPQPEVAAAPPLAGADIVLTPDAKHLFMSIRDFAGDTDLIARYRVAADGSLEPLPGTPADDVPWGMSVSADGRFMAVTNFGGKTLSVYRIDVEGGLERLTTVDVEDRLLDVVVR